MPSTVRQATHTLRAGVPTLSYACHLPEPRPGRPHRAALIAHPWRRLGGSKDDHVVVALAEMLADEGYAVVRFDARGSTWTGAAEAADFRELVDDLVLPLLFPDSEVPAPSRPPNTFTPEPAEPFEILLCGYSFGSLAASSCPPPSPPPSLPHAQLRTSYLLISYPLSVLWALTSLHSGPPTSALHSLVARGENRVLALHGDKDDFSAIDKLRTWVAGLEVASAVKGMWRAVEVEGADHFWRDGRKKREMLETVREWVRGGHGGRHDGASQ
ncbi:hypothetical protein JCM3770_000478 [Rhodotorula araucariae]